ncbi:MAG: pentapeptide repeat-containing protein [Elainella sp. C42_A2020_010]|nr:pentapeptide repeat-containing protein [Elainella sp. C42_A2020_010]
MTPDPRFPASSDDSTSGNPAQLRRSAANSISADANGAKSSSMDTSSSTRMPVQPVERSVSPAQLSPQDDFAVSSSVQPYAPRLAPQRQPLPVTLLILLALVLMLVGLTVDNFWMGLAGAGVAMLLSLQILWATGSRAVNELLSVQERRIIVSILGVTLAGIGLLRLSGWGNRFLPWYQNLNWEAIGALGEVFGAVGQILIAILAVYIAWRQYVISKDLTIQQNIITQQQTIDSYFQGISELVLDEEGLLEDWPQERAVAEGRTAAILSSIDASGKAKVLRFLSRSRLLTPLKRDRRLGRAILDGTGGYAEDRNYGVRVIDLGVMLAGTDLSGTDLRWTDLSDINLIRANLRNCDLVKTNFARTILCEAILAGSDMMGTRLFYGPVATASPRTRADIPDYTTGAHTGAVIEGADLTGVQRLSEEQRYYCCAWGGSATRATIPGGCDGIPNLLER